MTSALIDLPPRIASALRIAGFADSFRYAAKTTVKPNETIPFLWLVCTDSHLLLCCTHRTRGIFRKYPWGTLNEVRKATSADNHTKVEVIHDDLELADDVYAMDKSASALEIDDLVAYCKLKIASHKCGPP